MAGEENTSVSVEGPSVETDPLNSDSLPESNPFQRCARPTIAPEIRTEYGDVVQSWPGAAQVPIVYTRGYNISFIGLEKLNTQDPCKFDRVVNLLIKQGSVEREQLVVPLEAPDETLADVHPSEYLTELRTNRWTVLQVTELPGLMLVPNFLLQWRVMRPLRFHASGTILAAGLAVERGWAINLGGGMIHARRTRGAGWCAYDDLTLAVRRLRKSTQGKIQRVMIIDLGAHQGNGYQRNKLEFEDEDLIVVDVYNSMIFPKDDDARKGINVEKQLRCGTKGEEYVSSVQEALAEAGREFEVDFIMYVAGTDVYAEDYSGQFGASREDVIQRDELVFGFALQKGIPICMTLSGGYGAKNAQLISDSVGNLVKKFDLVQ